MNDSDIQQFISAFKDFMKHSEENIDSHNRWEEARHYVVNGNHRMNAIDNMIEKNANKLGVSVEYYIQEFT